MALDILQAADIIEMMENYIESIRPDESIRHKLDIAYKIENQSIILYTIQPKFGNPEIKMESPVAKTTYIHKQKIWKIFWMRASGKWETYSPMPMVKNLKDFLNVVQEDKGGAFWG